MTSMPSGVDRRVVDGRLQLVTKGEAVYGEPTDDGWRVWDPNRSKVAAMIEREMSIDFEENMVVLYLGGGAGTTVSHIADLAKVVYAVEFAPRPARRLLEVARQRSNVIPLLKDARRPETYAHLVEANCDLLIQDVATRGQASVACENQRFLADGGRALISIKARSEEVTAQPQAVFESARSDLEETYELLDETTLEPFHADHLAVVARPRRSSTQQ